MRFELLLPDQRPRVREREGFLQNPVREWSQESREGTVAPFIKLTFGAAASRGSQGTRQRLNFGEVAGLPSRDRPTGP